MPIDIEEIMGDFSGPIDLALLTERGIDYGDFIEQYSKWQIQKTLRDNFLKYIMENENIFLKQNKRTVKI